MKPMYIIKNNLIIVLIDYNLIFKNIINDLILINNYIDYFQNEIITLIIKLLNIIYFYLNVFK